MSRVGKMPITVPKGVKAEVVNGLLKVEGPKGKLQRQLRPEVTASLQDGTLVFARTDDSSSARAYHGLERALANNMIVGVSEGFAKELQLIGVGYRAELQGSVLNLALGYSHTIDFPLPAGVKGTVTKDNRDIFVKLEGADRQLVGQTAANIRSLRPPEPYKGKGVRYRDEVVKLKAGKTAKK